MQDSLPQLRERRESVDAELAERMRLGQELLAFSIRSKKELERARDDYYIWDEVNTELLRRRFTTSEFADDYSRLSPSVGMMDPSLEDEIKDLHDDIRAKMRRLRSIRERLQYCEEPTTASPSVEIAAGQGDTIFVIHGRDEARKEAVARLMEDATTRSIVILHEQPDMGRTVIEKLEAVAPDAAFAVALLTADDVGGLRTEEVPPALEPRARQNVIFEAGYFMRALGRGRVALLYDEGIAAPSDMGGMLYTPIDAGGSWKMKLGRELQAAGIEFDAAVLMR